MTIPFAVLLLLYIVTNIIQGYHLDMLCILVIFIAILRFLLFSRSLQP